MDIRQILVGWIRETKAFLGDGEIQSESDYSHLKEEFAGLVAMVYEGCCAMADAGESVISFELRVGLWKMLAEWCGQPAQAILNDDAYDKKTNPSVHSGGEHSKWSLEHASLKSMATLCACLLRM
jgi:hypothetical protein